RDGAGTTLGERLVDIEQRLYRDGRLLGAARTGALGAAQRCRAADGFPEHRRVVVLVVAARGPAHRTLRQRSASRYFSASRAAIPPLAALVTAWRETWSWTSP